MAESVAKDFSNEIDDLEKHFRDIFASIGSQLKVLVHKGAKFVEILTEYASSFGNQGELQRALMGLADTTQQVCEQQLKLDIIHARENAIKKRDSKRQAYNKEQNQVKKTKLGTELAEMEKDVKKADAALFENVEQVEIQKVRDIKQMCVEYLHASLMYHGKCLEALTKTTAMFDRIDEEKESENWLRRVQPTRGDSSLQKSVRNSKKSNEDENEEEPLSKSYLRESQNTTPLTSNKTKTRLDNSRTQLSSSRVPTTNETPYTTPKSKTSRNSTNLRSSSQEDDDEVSPLSEDERPSLRSSQRPLTTSALISGTQPSKAKPAIDDWDDEDDDDDRMMTHNPVKMPRASSKIPKQNQQDELEEFKYSSDED